MLVYVIVMSFHVNFDHFHSMGSKIGACGQFGVSRLLMYRGSQTQLSCSAQDNALLLTSCRNSSFCCTGEWRDRVTRTRCEQPPSDLDPYVLLLTSTSAKLGGPAWRGQPRLASSLWKQQADIRNWNRRLETRLHGEVLWKLFEYF